MADLDHEREAGERPEEAAQPLLARLVALEGPRELEQRRAEPTLPVEPV